MESRVKLIFRKFCFQKFLNLKHNIVVIALLLTTCNKSYSQISIELIGFDSISNMMVIFQNGKNLYNATTIQSKNHHFYIDSNKIKSINLLTIIDTVSNFKKQIIYQNLPLQLKYFKTDDYDSLATNSIINNDWNDIQKMDFFADKDIESNKSIIKLSESNGNTNGRKTAFDEISKIYHERDSLLQLICDRNSNNFLKSLQNLKYDFKIPSQIRGSDRKSQANFVMNNYLEYYNLDNPKLRFSPYYFDRIEKYINLCLNFGSDTLIHHLDNLINKIKEKEDSIFYRTVCSDIVNLISDNSNPSYERTFIHLVNKYITTNDFYWTSEEEKKRFESNANLLENNTIGKIAPDITFLTSDSTTLHLHQVIASITVLVFWDPDCKVCQKTMPILEKIYKEFKDKGVEIVGLCARKNNSYPQCWEYAKSNGYDWIIGVDPTLASNYANLYNVTNLPLIYLLDKDKMIFNKKVKAEKLYEWLKIAMTKQQN